MQEMTKRGRASNVRRVGRIAFGIARRTEQTFLSAADYRNAGDCATVFYGMLIHSQLLADEQSQIHELFKKYILLSLISFDQVDTI